MPWELESNLLFIITETVSHKIIFNAERFPQGFPLIDESQ